MKKVILILIIFGLLIMVAPYFFNVDRISISKNTIEINEEFLLVDISYPVVEGFIGADKLNSEIEKKNEIYLKEAKSAGQYMKEESDKNVERGGEDFITSVSLETEYSYIEIRDILSLQLNTYYYSGGAHPIAWIDAFTVNTKTGEILKFKDLFKEDMDSISFISEEIITKINKDRDSYLDGYEQAIKDLEGDFKYYFEEDSVVVYFDLYELAAYAYGMPEFRFPFEEIKDLLKDEVYQ